MTARRKAYHHGDLRNALLSCALRLIKRKGIGAVSLRIIAAQAGVSASAIYRHFASKEDLLASLAAEGFMSLSSAFTATLAAHRDRSPPERLKALGEAYIAFGLDRPEHYQLMFGASVNSRRHSGLEDAAARSFNQLVEAVAACFEPNASQRTILAAALSAWSLVHGYVQLRQDGRLDDLPENLAPTPGEVVAALFAGVTGPGPAK
jgi:AcrR family transcriptional regulator